MSSLPALRITHIDTGLSLRGGQRQMLMLAEGLHARGHAQTVVCLEGSSLEASARQLGLHVFALPAHDPANAFGIMLWRQQIKTWAPQVIHAHDGRGQTLAWLASLGLPVRRVASRRVTFFPSDRWTYRLKYGRTCHAVVAVSENIRERSVQAGVPRERIAVIPDGIDLPAELPTGVERQALRAAWQCQPDDFVVGMLGAATPEKGQDVALAAMELLAPVLPNARLLLAGGETGAGAICEARHPNAALRSERVIALGAIEGLDRFLPGLDLFIMPSKAEGLGSSALWAMAYGLPVVATRVGGLPEIVMENHTGWLIPPSSPQALADAIVVAARDRDRRCEFGRNARRQAEGFSAAIMVGRTEALYYRLTGYEPGGTLAPRFEV
jgi:glycosyltransferase involved in cell wall biosynthesis